ncbi:hypothetical protein ACHAWF_009744 [Thalassiosira exigua]
MSRSVEPLLPWEAWHGWHGQSWRSPLDEIEHLLDSQRRWQAMLADGDIFYSRTDLRMFIDKYRTEAKLKILALYSSMYLNGDEVPQEFLLHAAARLKVSPINTVQLIKDYPYLVWQTRPNTPHGSLPIHFAAAAVGSDHLGRLKPFLSAFPDAVKQTDESGLVPMQVALVHGAGFDVMKQLIDAFPPALEYPLHPRPPVSQDLEPLVGLLPFHVACARNNSLDVIYLLLLEGPECAMEAYMFEKLMGKLTL